MKPRMNATQTAEKAAMDKDAEVQAILAKMKEHQARTEAWFSLAKEFNAAVASKYPAIAGWASYVEA